MAADRQRGLDARRQATSDAHGPSTSTRPTPPRSWPTWPKPPAARPGSATCASANSLDRYLSWLETGRRSSTVRGLRELTEAIVEPAIGRHCAALLDAPDIYRLLRDRHHGRADRDELRAILRLLADTWARDKSWTTRDPIGGLTIRVHHRLTACAVSTITEDQWGFVTLRQEQLAGITMRYDRARVSLDRHATYVVAAFIAGAARCHARREALS